jgi:hypothetical protein
MEKNERIEALKDRLEENLLYVSTTSESTGYPKNIRTAYLFTNWDDIQDILKGNEDLLSCEVFMKREGWDLYYRTGKQVDEPFKITAELVGGSREYNNVGEVSAECFKNIKERDWSCVEELYDYVEKMNDMSNYAENLGDEEVLIEFDYNFGVFDKEDVSYNKDGKYYEIGLIFK